MHGSSSTGSIIEDLLLHNSQQAIGKTISLFPMHVNIHSTESGSGSHAALDSAKSCHFGLLATPLIVIWRTVNLEALHS